VTVFNIIVVSCVKLCFLSLLFYQLGALCIRLCVCLMSTTCAQAFAGCLSLRREFDWLIDLSGSDGLSNGLGPLFHDAGFFLNDFEALRSRYHYVQYNVLKIFEFKCWAEVGECFISNIRQELWLGNLGSRR